MLQDSNQVSLEVAKMSKGFNDAQDQLPKYVLVPWCVCVCVLFFAPLRLGVITAT